MALNKCFEPECNKMVSDKAEHCPECGHPIISHLKKVREASPEMRADFAVKQKQEKWEREDREKAERKAKLDKEEEEKARKLEIFKELRDKLNK